METVGQAAGRAVCSEWEERDQIQRRPQPADCWVPCHRSPCSGALGLTYRSGLGQPEGVSWTWAPGPDDWTGAAWL